MQKAVVLEPYQANWPADDPNADFRGKVAEYSRLDPLPTLESLSRSTGIPIGSLARFVLVRYCTSGSDALLEMGPRVVRQMDEIHPAGRGREHGRSPARRLPGAESHHGVAYRAP